jgi:hypothetical protein
MSDFRCWDPDNCEEDDAKTINAPDAEWAAELYMEQMWADMDYVSELLIHVRDEAGRLTKWNVRAEPDVRFSAASKEER